MPTISTAPRRAWIFDPADRLSALATRARELSETLRRERCDLMHDPSARARLAERIAILEARFRRLATRARATRRLNRPSGLSL